MDVNWRSLTVNQPIVLDTPKYGKININYPIGLFQVTHPQLAQQLLSSPAYVSCRILYSTSMLLENLWTAGTFFLILQENCQALPGLVLVYVLASRELSGNSLYCTD